eukprot:Skav224848  [mRNA]  locus=scaffold322:715:1122:- [translate_table: standard]
MAEFRMKLHTSQISLRDVLETLDDHTLKNLTDLFKSSTGKNTEERIYKASPMISRDIHLIDRTIPRLMNLRHHMMLLVAEAFVREFNDPKGTDLVCKPEKMTDYLLNLSSYRRGIQSSRSEQSTVSEVSSTCRMG